MFVCVVYLNVCIFILVTNECDNLSAFVVVSSVDFFVFFPVSLCDI